MGTKSTPAFPAHDSDHPYRPPSGRIFTPTIQQMEDARKAKNTEIDHILRPKKAPLPARLPPQDEAYVDAILTKRGTLSKTGREQVGDKDIARLRPRQWLTDEIINFYGQLILSRSESRKENSKSTPIRGHINGLVNGAKGKGKAVEEKHLLNLHYFNTFFWPKLTGDGYDGGGLAKWTKKVKFSPNPPTCSALIHYFCKFDLFSKDVVLIPINHHPHWATAAINFRRKRIESYDSTGMARTTVHKVLTVLPPSFWDPAYWP